MTTEERKSYMRERRKRHRANGWCVDCKHPPMPGKTRCEKHCQQHLDANRKRRRISKELGLCADCRCEAEPGKTRCQKCMDRIKMLVPVMRERRRKNGLCVQCGKPLGKEEIKAGHISHFWKDCGPTRSNR